MGVWEQQIAANAAAIQTIINNAKNIKQHPALAGNLVKTDCVLIQIDATNQTVKISLTDLATIIATINNTNGTNKVKINEYWVDKNGNLDTDNFEVGDDFEGWASGERYVVGKVVGLPFDIDDITKCILVIDNNIGF